jgi:hypothetical protein
MLTPANLRVSLLLLFAAAGCERDEDASMSTTTESVGCDDPVGTLSLDESRGGVQVAEIVDEYVGVHHSPLTWVGSSGGPGAVDFELKSTTTELTLELNYGGGDVLWFEGGGTGGAGCAARISVPMTATASTADGGIDSTWEVHLDRFVEDVEDVEAAILDQQEGEAWVEPLGLSLDPPDLLVMRSTFLASFAPDGEMYGSLSLSLGRADDMAVAGVTAILAEWGTPPGTDTGP